MGEALPPKMGLVRQSLVVKFDVPPAPCCPFWPEFAVGPSVTPFSFWVAGQVEHLNITFPNRLAPEHLMHWRGIPVNGGAVVQVLNHHLQPFDVLLIAHKQFAIA